MTNRGDDLPRNQKASEAITPGKQKAKSLADDPLPASESSSTQLIALELIAIGLIAIVGGVFLTRSECAQPIDHPDNTVGTIERTYAHVLPDALGWLTAGRIGTRQGETTSS